MMDGIVSKMEGEVYIAVDIGDTEYCVEWTFDKERNIHIINSYEVNR